MKVHRAKALEERLLVRSRDSGTFLVRLVKARADEERHFIC